VLQDVHWSAGLIGYFSTYALGNMIAGQLWRQVTRTFLTSISRSPPPSSVACGAGWWKLAPHGSKLPLRAARRVVGREIEVEPFVSYLKAKMATVYEFLCPQPPGEESVTDSPVKWR